MGCFRVHAIPEETSQHRTQKQRSLQISPACYPGNGGICAHTKILCAMQTQFSCSEEKPQDREMPQGVLSKEIAHQGNQNGSPRNEE